MEMTRDEFEKVMTSALEALPPEFKEKLGNIVIIIEDKKRPRNLLGLYEGTPLIERRLDEGWSLPDKITLYKRSLEEMCGGDKKLLRLEIKRTLAHEIAHHFGIDDDRMEELGLD